MPLDPSVARFLRLLGARGAGSADDDLAARRAGLAELMRFGGPPPPAQSEDRRLRGSGGDLGVRIITPPGLAAGPGPGLVYFHGGGLVAGSIDTHDPLARALAVSAGCRVVSVEYRLAPEAPFPAALDDAVYAVRQVRADPEGFGIDGSRLGVCGDSAGGTLAAAVCATLAAEAGPPLAMQVLLCPILDHSRSSASRREYASGHLVGQAILDQDLALYLPRGTDPADPRVSPLRAADLRALPPTLVHTAECDPLRDEGHAYAERLGREGVAVSYTCHPGMIHLFYGLGAVIPYAHTALDRIGAEIRAGWR